jgi:membrane fusion protein (multidrug efflux system)
MTPNKKKIVLIYWSVCFLLLTAGFLYWFLFWRFRAYTDDAYVEGNQVYITPLHSGFVQAIHTDDTYLVHKGQLLIELDETDALISLNNAKQKLAQTVRDVCQMFHQVFVYQADMEIKKAEWIKAAQDYEHREGVIEEGGVSIENFEHAIAALRANFFSMAMVQFLYEKTLSGVQNTSLRTHPLILAAADSVRDAWVHLYRCKIYSPVEGLAAQRKIQVGMWIDSGKPLMSVIPLDQLWVNANFKETQLRHMKIGQNVKLTSDLYGDNVIFHGKVIGLPGAAGNTFSLLPPQNLSGNWIKIVQRLPVRVSLDLDECLHHPLRLGLSMEATVDLRDQHGLLVPTSSKGSPLYETSIFQKEETGDEALIKQIILDNVDPKLTSYIDTPIHFDNPPPPSWKNLFPY